MGKSGVLTYCLTEPWSAQPACGRSRCCRTLYDYFDGHHEDIFETIRTTKDLPEESVLNEAIQAFKDQSEYK